VGDKNYKKVYEKTVSIPRKGFGCYNGDVPIKESMRTKLVNPGDSFVMEKSRARSVHACAIQLGIKVATRCMGSHDKLTVFLLDK